MNAVPLPPTNPPSHRSIRVLPDDVASKIAAGEVIERPASVVRELLDNAIDAGAGHIRVELRNGGRDLIRVIDDGYGMAPEEMPRAFLRHATSKILTADDLWAVTTLGFRGEALYSIAAVSRTTLASRREESPAGYELSIEAGRMAAQGVRGMPAGTIVTVTDLFYNLPARLKFLKSAPAESAHIAALVQQYALAHPAICFTLANEGRQTFRSPGSGDLREAALCVYGAETARALLPVGIEPGEEGSPAGLPVDGEIAVYGYASPPAISRSNRGAMHFFINRRSVQSRMLLYAVEEAYHSLLMVGRRPVCIINVLLDPASLDVNVHPAKAEVKFRDERAAFSAVQRAVRSALTAHVPPPMYGSRGGEGWALPSEEAGPQESSFGEAISFTGGHPGPLQSDMWVRHEAAGPAPVELPPPPARNLPPLRVVGQIGMTYIIAEGPEGLFLIDQHAAHERILYEKLAREIAQGKLPVQPLLQPASLELTSRQRAEVERIMPLMSELGFEFEPFGDSALLVRAVPAAYAESRRDLARDVLEVIDTVINGSVPERWREEMVITLACHSAIRAGKTLTLDEMRAMLDQLELCEFPRSCAHGRPTMLHLSQAQLEREFGRRV
jgi:DNA mismatch repair protein MutL